MDYERGKSAKEIEQEAVMVLARGGGGMSLETFDEALRNLGLLNPRYQIGNLIQKGLIEELEGKNYVRLPFEPPQREQA